MCGVEGAEYGLQRIFVWRGMIITGAPGLSLPGAGPGCAALRYLRARPVPAGARRSPRARRRTS
jgi:hypothetical protein